MGGFLNMFPMMDYTGGHGIFGSIISIDNNNIIILDQDYFEKRIVISSDTAIRDNTKIIDISDLKVGDNVVIIGSPNEEGQIEAKFIRVIPDSAAIRINQRLFRDI